MNLVHAIIGKNGDLPREFCSKLHSVFDSAAAVVRIYVLVLFVVLLGQYFGLDQTFVEFAG